MKAEERREEILKELRQTEKPLSAGRMAERYGVSRQIIVGDIALLRAKGYPVIATARGYRLPKEEGKMYVISCVHTGEQMREELYTLVDHGCTVRDVFVEHPIYHELRGALGLSSRLDVDRFIESCERHEALPLSVLTEGVHSHTVLCADEEAFRLALQALREKGMLIE